MLLILSSADDPHADYVEHRLASAAGAFQRVDLCDASHLSLAFSTSEPGVPKLGALDVSHVRGVWYRRPTAPSSRVDASARAHAQAETRALFLEVLAAATSSWFPASPHVVRQADRKPIQLQLARQLAFGVPTTLITNDADAALDFFRRHDGDVITKLPSSTACEAPTRVFRYTERLSVHQLGAMRADLAHCPVMMQAAVRKKLELRVTVVGEEVFAAEIDSQSGARTRVDWRRFAGHTSYRPHALPAEVAGRCIELVRQLGLLFGAIDLILTPEGDYVFLEINPNGQWLWVEKLTGQPIGDAICRTLLAFKERS